MSPHLAHGRRRFLPLSISTSLVALVVLPLAIAIALAATVVANQASIRAQAVTTRQSSLELDSLLRARIDVQAEYVFSASIVAAQAYHVSAAELDLLTGVNVQKSLAEARRAVDRQRGVFGPKGAFAPEYARLLALRRKISRGGESFVAVASFFSNFNAAIDAHWDAVFRSLSKSSQSTASTETKSRLAAVGSTFDAFESGLGEDSLQGGGSIETVLETSVTAADIKDLLVNHQQFETTVSDFPAALGPEATAAWKKLVTNPLSRRFEGYVALATAVSLGSRVPPYAGTTNKISAIAKSEVAWGDSLSSVVLASSADLRVATASQADSATRYLTLISVAMFLLVLGAIGSVVIFGRAIRRPLSRIASALNSVQEGELEFPQLDETGPREIALASVAFNQMSSTLHVVQAQAIALSTGELDDAVLQRPLPGRTGAALQSALTKLQLSVRASETQRGELIERAMRDSLTGLLNRGAALEALDIDLARARRSAGALELAVLFIDLDELKQINDSLGHDGGDEAIVAVAEALRATTRATDVIARFGGDEFVVGWLGERGSEGPALLARRICTLVSNSVVESEGSSRKLGCSIGVAVSEPHDRTVESLIERADHALYEAKASGRGQVRWFGRDQADRRHDAPGEFVAVSAK